MYTYGSENDILGKRSSERAFISEKPPYYQSLQTISLTWTGVIVTSLLVITEWTVGLSVTHLMVQQTVTLLTVVQTRTGS